MKIFNFIGSILGHSEALVDSTFGTAIEVSDTVRTLSRTLGNYATHQETISVESGPIIIKTALFEQEDDFDILVAKRTERRAAAAANTSTKTNTTNALDGLV